MPGFNPDKINIHDLTIEEPVPKVQRYSLGDRCRDGRIWVDSSKEAKREWDIFWGKSAESEEKEKWARMKAENYRRLYTHLTGERVGPDASSGDDWLDGFDDNGIGYKDIEEKPLSSDCPPMPEPRNF
jgi:hypothetical protein